MHDLRPQSSFLSRSLLAATLLATCAGPAHAFRLGDILGGVAEQVLKQQVQDAVTQSQQQPAPAGSGSGQSVDVVTGKSYAASQGSGGTSLAEIARLPAEVAPMPLVLRATNAEALTGMPRIVIPNYGIAFVRSAEAFASTASAGGFLSDNRRSVKVQTALVGIDEAALAAWVEQAHSDLLARLAAAGIEPVPNALFRQALGEHNADFWVEGNRSSGKRILDGRGEKGWLTIGASGAPLIRTMALDSQFGLAGTMMKAQDAAARLDAVVVHPLLVLDYIALDSSGNRTFAYNASISAEALFSVHPASRVDFGFRTSRGGNGGAFTLEGRAASNEPFAVIYETADRSDNVQVHNALAMMGLGSNYRQSKVYAVEAAPARYAALVKAAYQGYNQALVEQIRKALQARPS